MAYFLHNYDLNDLILWLLKLLGHWQQPEWYTAANVKKYFDKGIAEKPTINPVLYFRQNIKNRRNAKD